MFEVFETRRFTLLTTIDIFNQLWMELFWRVVDAATNNWKKNRPLQSSVVGESFSLGLMIENDRFATMLCVFIVSVYVYVDSENVQGCQKRDNMSAVTLSKRTIGLYRCNKRL